MQSTSKPYILFVDDEEMTRRMFERIAGSEFNVLTAESVADAKSQLDSHTHDIGVLLTDQRMPGELGVELLEYCRENYPGIVRMLTTAYSDLADAIAAVNRGEIIRYIEKPWNNIDALLIDLRVAMRFHLLERENRKLMEEKLSVGAATSRLDRIRALIGLAAAQYDYAEPLRAVERMLRDLAGMESIKRPLDAEVVAEMEMFGQPLTDTRVAIDIADALHDHKREAAEADWAQLLQVVAEYRGELQVETRHQPPGELSAEIARMGQALCQVLAGQEPENLSLSVRDKQGGGWQLEAHQRGRVPSYIGDWIAGATLEPGNQSVAALLQVYLSATQMGAQIRAYIKGNGIEALDIEIPAQPPVRDAQASQPKAEWVDDILLLFS